LLCDTDEQIFNRKFEAVGDDANSIILTLRVGESIAFKKASNASSLSTSTLSLYSHFTSLRPGRLAEGLIHEH